MSDNIVTKGVASADHMKNALYSNVVLYCNSLDSAIRSVEMKLIKLMAEHQLHDLYDTWVLNINRHPI